MNQDLTLTCADCSQQFAFTTGEQEYYKQKGLEDPKHCLICRGKYKAMQKDKSQYKKLSKN